MDFIQSYLNYTQRYESPSSFWKWSAYTIIAGILRDNLWMIDGDSKLFPNIYTIFVGDSASRKGRPVTMAQQLIKSVNNVKTIVGRASIQAVLRDIGQTETDKKTGKLQKGGAAIMLSKELSAGLVGDDESIQILTDIYDYSPTEYTISLVVAGKSELGKLVFSMLGASNEELLKIVYTSRAIYGGLLGRTFIVAPNEFRPGQANPEGDEDVFQELTKQLLNITNYASGIIRFEPTALEEYTKWYLDFRLKSKDLKDKTGLYGRIPTHVKKLGMILAANECAQQLKKCHYEQAIQECLSLIPNYNAFIYSAGTSTIKDCGVIMLDLFQKGQEVIDRKEFLMENWHLIDADIFDKTVIHLETGKWLESCVFNGTVKYRLTKLGKEKILKTKETTNGEAK